MFTLKMSFWICLGISLILATLLLVRDAGLGIVDVGGNNSPSGSDIQEGEVESEMSDEEAWEGLISLYMFFKESLEKAVDSVVTDCELSVLEQEILTIFCRMDAVDPRYDEYHHLNLGQYDREIYSFSFLVFSEIPEKKIAIKKFFPEIPDFPIVPPVLAVSKISSPHIKNNCVLISFTIIKKDEDGNDMQDGEIIHITNLFPYEYFQVSTDD